MARARPEILSTKVSGELKSWLQEEAERNFRTLSAEVEMRLELQMRQSKNENAQPAATGQASVTQ